MHILSPFNNGHNDFTCVHGDSERLILIVAYKNFFNLIVNWNLWEALTLYRLFLTHLELNKGVFFCSAPPSKNYLNWALLLYWIIAFKKENEFPKRFFLIFSRVVFLSFGLQAFSYSGLQWVRTVLSITRLIQKGHGTRARFSLGTNVNTPFFRAFTPSDLGTVPRYGGTRLIRTTRGHAIVSVLSGCSY